MLLIWATLQIRSISDSNSCNTQNNTGDAKRPAVFLMMMLSTVFRCKFRRKADSFTDGAKSDHERVADDLDFEAAELTYDFTRPPEM